MQFYSVVFLFAFLPVTLLLHLLAPRSGRNGFLVLASLAFYGWGTGSLFWVLPVAVLGNYAAGIFLEKVPRPGSLAVVVSANLLLLWAFKYHRGFTGSGGEIRLLGVSFFTFHVLSYLFDVYRGEVKAERSLVRLMLYIVFFPQLLVGPIVLYRQMRDQLRQRTTDLTDLEAGATRFVLGLARKVLIADHLAPIIERIWTTPAATLSPQLAIFGVFCFALQIYHDFGGYTDMAIGLARLFGFRFPENFRYPWSAVSVAEFWSHWHMSLGNWFRNYVYFPVAARFPSRPALAVLILFIFALIGLWHGFSLHFLAFGLWSGLLFIAEAGIWRNRRVPSWWRVYTLSGLAVSLILFRSPTLSVAGLLLSRCLGHASPELPFITPAVYLDPYTLVILTIAVLSCRRWSFSWKRSMFWCGDWFAAAAQPALLGLLFLVCSGRILAASHISFLYLRF